MGAYPQMQLSAIILAAYMEYLNSLTLSQLRHPQLLESDAENLMSLAQYRVQCVKGFKSSAQFLMSLAQYPRWVFLMSLAQYREHALLGHSLGHNEQQVTWRTPAALALEEASRPYVQQPAQMDVDPAGQLQPAAAHDVTHGGFREDRVGSLLYPHLTHT